MKKAVVISLILCLNVTLFTVTPALARSNHFWQLWLLGLERPSSWAKFFILQGPMITITALFGCMIPLIILARLPSPRPLGNIGFQVIGLKATMPGEILNGIGFQNIGNEYSNYSKKNYL